MAIGKKPIRRTNEVQHAEKAAEAFIAGAGLAALTEPTGPEPRKPEHKVPVMIRFDRDLLRRIDEAARRRGVSRSAFISFALSECWC